jgi:catechol 2,3-dioxygenase-like lactoylglutathione lyase family enzyme
VLDHLGIHVSDRAASERFYETVLATLGIEPSYRGERYTEWNEFALAQATDERPPARRLHIGFAAPSRAHVDAFWQAGIDAGYRDDGEPGERPQYSDDYYGAFLLDPDGNSAEAVHHSRVPDDGRHIDHFWLRVHDLEAACRFYETIAPHAGFRRVEGLPDHAHFDEPGVKFTLVAGEPTEHVHMAFSGDRDAVHAFHAAALAAGFRDNGAPGERPEYHPGYYAAFVLDPDGNNVEIVDHGREA